MQKMCTECFAQLAERAADDRLHGEFGPGLQRAAQGHQALAAAQVVAVAVADRVTYVSADDQGEQSLGAVQVARLPHGVAALLQLVVLAVFDN